MLITADVPRSELEHLIDEWILNERYRVIIKRRLLDGVTYERLAEEVDMGWNGASVCYCYRYS